MKTLRAFLWLGLLVTPWGAGAQEPGADEALEDLQPVLQALAEAGQWEDVPPERGGRNWAHGGKLSLWTDWQEDDLSTKSRLSVKLNGLDLRGKVQQDEMEARVEGLTLGLSWSRWQIRAGSLGLTVGHGLLLAGPGRRRSLNAMDSFQSARVRLKGWSTTAEERSIFGWGLQGRAGLWRWTVAHGAPGRAQPGTGYLAAVSEYQGKEDKGAVALVQAQNMKGGSLSGIHERGAWRWTWELAAHQDTSGAPVAALWTGGLRWTLGQRCQQEFRVAGSTSEQRPWTGVRSPLLTVQGGTGWAWRGKFKPSPDWTAALLLGKSQGSDQQSVVRVRSQWRGQIQIEYRLRPSWSLLCRWRSDRKEKWEWSTDYPWLPAELVEDVPRQSFQVRAQRTVPTGSMKFAMLRQVQGWGTERQIRSTMGVGGGRPISRLWTFGFQQTWAWGDPVDVVTAIVPVPGLVLPRHMGRWRSESLLKLGRKGELLTLAVGLSRRLPDPGSEQGDEIGIWLSGGIRW